MFFVVDGSWEEKKFQLGSVCSLRMVKQLFFFPGAMWPHFQRHRFDHHSGEWRRVFFDLLELAVLVDDRFEIGVLLGEFLETRGISDEPREWRVPRSFPGSGRLADRVFQKA